MQYDAMTMYRSLSFIPLFGLVGLLTAGCNALFYPGSAFDGTSATDLGTVVDLQSAGDASQLDDASQADGPAPDAAAGEQVLAAGVFGGRAGHQGGGHASLVQTISGQEEIVLAQDFFASGVPGPVVVLTARSSLGTSLAAEDLQLGVLASNTGAGRYPIAGSSGGRRNLFIFCKPFGVEVSLAPLVDQP